MLNLSKFSERLSELYEENNLDAVTLAEAIGVHRNTIHRYLAGSKAPTLKSALKLADYFNCSIEFLLGRTDSNNLHQYKDLPSFSERLKFLFVYFGSNEYRFAKDTKISRSSTYDRLSGKRIPSLDNIVKIAEYFDCTVDFVIGREK